MNESDNKIKIVKGKVSQAGYEDAICTFIKASENRNDSFSDKPLYIVEDLKISDGIYAVTPNVTEALGRAPRKTIGVMNDGGELLVPIINSDIVTINNNYIAIKTTSSMQELEIAKSDPTKVQENAEIGQGIKNKILESDSNARFICDDYYGTYDVYEIKDNNLIKACTDVSYIAIDSETIYAQTNNLGDDVQIFGKRVEEPRVTMPVGALADVTDKPLDNLGELPEMPAELPGAPELKEEISEGSFDIDEMQKELANFESEVEVPEAKQEPEESKVEIDTKVEDEPEIKEEIEEERTVFTDSSIKSEIKDKKEDYKFERTEKNDINSLVSAVKARMEEHEEEIKKLQDENAEKESALEDKDGQIKELQDKNSKKDDEIAELKAMLDEAKEELKDKNNEIESLNRKADKYQETMSTIYNEFAGMLDNDDSFGRGYSKVA